jgi:hypothetical protein
MNPLITETLEALRGVGWKVKLADRPEPLPASVAERHPNLPPLAVEFFTHVHSCADAEERAWFLAAEDFARTEDGGWDEYERMVLKDTGEEQAQEVRAFWNAYLPIFYLPEDDFQYLALGTDPSSRHFGKVVWHAEAIYDEVPGVITDTYEDFLVRLRDVARRDPNRTSNVDATVARLILPDFESVAPESRWTRIKRWFQEAATLWKNELKR